MQNITYLQSRKETNPILELLVSQCSKQLQHNGPDQNNHQLLRAVLQPDGQFHPVLHRDL